MNQHYIRFKEIPKNEISSIYDGDIGKVGEELGVCCFQAVKIDNTFRIILPSLTSGCLFDLSGFISDFQDGVIPAYLVDGNLIGVGTYGEPLLKNVKKIGKLGSKEFSDKPPRFKLDKTDRQFIQETELNEDG